MIFFTIVNNADRKGGHILAEVDGRVYNVDHRVSHTIMENKLRTVLWGWTANWSTTSRSAISGTKLLGGPLGEEPAA